jgi:RNA polymerase sigma factor for flagellar operon FliA
MKKRHSRDELIADYQDFVHRLAQKMLKSLNLSNDHQEEFISAGYLGLVEAAERFDFNAGRNFKSWAFIRIRGAIIDHIRELNLSRRAYVYAKALESAHELRVKEYEENNKSGSIKMPQIMRYLASGAIAFRLTYEEIEDQITNEDQSKSNPENNLEKQQLRKRLLAAIDTLGEKEQQIIKDYYFEDKSFAQIVKENPELSKSWVSRLHKRALEKMQQALLNENLN